jgi:ABC-type phosphate transport system auxiliary subunit
MATTLPIEIYDILERKVGRDDAREIGKVIEFSFGTIEKKAEDVALQKKLELKDELTKELASKADILLTKTELRAEIDKVRSEIDKLRVELEGKIDRLEIKLESKMRIYFLILLFTIIILNPKSIELVSKLLGILK